MNFLEIEKKWVNIWSTYNFNFDPTKKKKYLLSMLPYPSGNLHMGHVKNYLISDILSRYYYANGFNVIHPIGWDAFGLPAENAARDNNVSPSDWTYQNIKNMREQLKKLCFFFDWSREFATCDDSYYKHEQEIFINFFKSNIAYQKNGEVNWDPVDNTVLANEQVIDGKGWRSGARVEKKNMQQWYLNISKYSQSLIDGIETLKEWPESVKSMQTEWIGKSTGHVIKFDLFDSSFSQIGIIDAFSTRIETLFGAKFIAISSKSKHISRINDKSILKNISDLSEKMQADQHQDIKYGVKTGLFCKNPLLKISLEDVKKYIHLFDEKYQILLKDITSEKFIELMLQNCEEYIPVYVANFVSEEYATGAVFGCPAHDERDFEFANQYNIGIKKVFFNSDRGDQKKSDFLKLNDTSICEHSFFMNNLTIHKAKKIISDLLLDINVCEEKVNFKIKDWCISRQRSWGCPIPIVYCDKCGVVAEKVENLPIKTFDKTSESLDTWKKCKCPKCENDAIRDTDTLDTFFESSWYFLRYLSQPEDTPFDLSVINELMPIDYYIGGIEHATMHLIYARFFMMALKDSGYDINFSEPFKKLVTQGMIRHEGYKSQKSNEWFSPNEIYKENEKAFLISTKEELEVVPSIKMSKSKKNTIEPLEMLEIYGADAIRFFIISDYPVESSFDWSDSGIHSSYKYVNKIYQKLNELRLKKPCEIKQEDLEKEEIDIYIKLTKQLKDAIVFIEKVEFNKLVASIRIIFSLISSIKNHSSVFFSYSVREFLKIFYYVCPNVSSELYSLIFDDKLKLLANEKINILNIELASSKIKLSIQINAKFRGTIEVEKGCDLQTALNIVNCTILFNKHLVNKVIKKTIFIEDKILNIITD